MKPLGLGGAGGCFVESDLEVREGDLVKLRRDMSGGGDLTIWGNVVFYVRHTVALQELL